MLVLLIERLNPDYIIRGGNIRKQRSQNQGHANHM